MASNPTRADFTFDATANAFICPAGKKLLNKALVREDGTVPNRTSTRDCPGCALKAAARMRLRAS